MNSYNCNEQKKHAEHSGKGKPDPESGLNTPDANVGMEGQCVVPPHPESARLDTGEPCDDGRANT